MEQNSTYLLEVGPNCEDLVDQVFDRQNIILAQRSFDDGIARQWYPLLIDLSISTLVDQLTDGFKVWLAIK